MEFVERQILPRYNAFGESHGLRHVTRVIKNSLRLADVTGADIDMVYVIAAYHDLGMEGPRAIHHLTSGKILMADARLKRWFNADQLKVMKEAVEDHRASSSRQPRSIYGKIVAEADRDIDVHEIFLRAIQYGKENDPDKTVEEHWERFAQHMDEKYSNNGYIKLWIPNSPNEKALKELRNIIEDKKLLRKAFDDIWKEMSEINP
ncbi:hD domain protein [Prevotella sp. CAG:732]|nr:hD domain protein [Prevotella sp. CAG:732]